MPLLGNEKSEATHEHCGNFSWLKARSVVLLGVQTTQAVEGTYATHTEACLQQYSEVWVISRMLV